MFNLKNTKKNIIMETKEDKFFRIFYVLLVCSLVWIVYWLTSKLTSIGCGDKYLLISVSSTVMMGIAANKIAKLHNENKK